LAHIYRVIFGEEKGQASDEIKIWAEDFEDAIWRAKDVSRRYVQDSDEAFELDKKSTLPEHEQRKKYHQDSLRIWAVSSIIYDSELGN